MLVSGEMDAARDENKHGVRWLPVYKSGRGMAGSNTPHQMSVTTKGIVASNFRRELRRATINLQPRDVILMGSDGLFGNLHEAEILNHVTLAATGGSPGGDEDATNFFPTNFYICSEERERERSHLAESRH